jgi:hypothetical protein
MRQKLRAHYGSAVALVGLAALIAAVAVALGQRSGSDPRDQIVTEGAAAEQVQSRRVQRGRRGPVGPPGPRGKQGKRGARGPQGATGPRGAAGANNERVYSMVLSWRGLANAPGNDVIQRAIPGIGTLTLACPTSNGGVYPGDRRLTLSNGSGQRVVATLTSFLDDSSRGENVQNQRQANPPGQISFGLPQNGMISGNLSVEPISGNGGPAGSLPNASILLSSYYQTNDATDPSNNWCHVSAQVIAKAVP